MDCNTSKRAEKGGLIVARQIYILPPMVANLIAAGEVIERPASVVKELLENSLDAKARRIQIDIEKGGLQLIRVRDDGMGMIKEDLALAPERHATSKIQTARDLEMITTLGFRGEALASIDSIAHLSITSLAEEEQTAWKLYRAPDKLEYTIEPAAHPRGTTVEVSELFCYAPVRRKFLRSEKTEYLALEDMVKRVMLSTFDVGFILRHNQRLVAQVRAGKSELEQDKRLVAVCGNPFLKNALRLDSSYEGMQLWGWLGLPTFNRSQSDLQYIYVNGRVVKDKILSHAIRSAYLDSIEEGRYPCYVLYLTIAPEVIDVNVHPTKQEVRFTDSRLVHEWLAMTLRNALQDALSVKIAVDAIPWPVENASPETTLPAAGSNKSLATCTPQFNTPQFNTQRTLYSPTVLNLESNNSQSTDTILGVFYQQYALLKRDEQLGWLDLQTLYHKNVYNKALRAWQGEPLKAQWLLLPQTYPFSGCDATSRLLMQKKLSALGIFFDWEEGMLTVRQLPALLKDCLNSAVFTAFLAASLADADNHAPWLSALIDHMTLPVDYFKKMGLEGVHRLWLEAGQLLDAERCIRWIGIEDVKRESIYEDLVSV
ncbi:MAG: mutL [Gammaproteobacteria bacterium]|nr:mutL [Gammaproteobacteria bacterium]